MLDVAVPAMSFATPPASTSAAVAAAAVMVGVSFVPVILKTALAVAVAVPSVVMTAKVSVTTSPASSA